MANAALFGGGNLVQNPGFETGNLANWSSASTNVTVVDTNLAHTGNFIARFNGAVFGAPAVLLQDVPITAGQVYALIFHVAGDASGTFDLRAQVVWLNQSLQEIGQGLDIFVNGKSIGVAADGEWSSQYQLTSPAPTDARFARLVFTSSPNAASNRILLDDVVLAIV